MEKLNLDPKNLKKFGITIATAFFLITLLFLIRHNSKMLITSAISGIFYILAFFAPTFLRSIYIFWMKLAYIMGWINTRLILMIIFYVVLTPISIGLKLFKVDLLDIKIDKNKDTYWRKKAQRVSILEDYKRQF